MEGKRTWELLPPQSAPATITIYGSSVQEPPPINYLKFCRDEAFYERPIAERHRVIFYLGHVEAFDWNLLGERAFGLRRFNRSFDQLFAFGIDPVGGGLPTDQPRDWPSRTQIAAYNERLRAQLDSALEQALEHPGEGHPQLLTMLDTAIEHRLMHAETLAYMFHRLPLEMKKRVRPNITLAHRVSVITWSKFRKVRRHLGCLPTTRVSDGTTSAEL